MSSLFLKVEVAVWNLRLSHPGAGLQQILKAPCAISPWLTSVTVGTGSINYSWPEIYVPTAEPANSMCWLKRQFFLFSPLKGVTQMAHREAYKLRGSNIPGRTSANGS